MDFEARFYDPWLARWTVVDPLASYEPSWSPYRYAFNNPVRYIDPSGLLEIDQIVDIFNNAPSGASSYDGNGNCTCGCEGKPPCESKSFTNNPFGAAAAAKVVQETTKKVATYSLGAIGAGVSAFITAMLSSHDTGEGSSKWTSEDQRLLDKLRFEESQGTLTDQQKRDLEELRGRFEESGLNAPSSNDAGLPKLGIKKFDKLDLTKASGDDLFNYARIFENQYKAGKIGAMTRNQAARFIRLLRKRGVKVRIDEPHLPPNPWQVPHLNVGDKGQIHVPILN